MAGGVPKTPPQPTSLRLTRRLSLPRWRTRAPRLMSDLPVAAVKNARGNSKVCDEVLAGLPGLNQDVRSADLAIEAALAQLVAAAPPTTPLSSWPSIGSRRWRRMSSRRMRPGAACAPAVGIGGTAASPFVH